MNLWEFLKAPRCPLCLKNLEAIEKRQNEIMENHVDEIERKNASIAREKLGLMIEKDELQSLKNLVKSQANHNKQLKERLEKWEEKLNQEYKNLNHYSKRQEEESRNQFEKRERLIDNIKQHLAEKESFLKKWESDIWSQKEKMAGTENLETKRQIILPSLQAKWEAEKEKIDAERVQILQSTPKVYESLRSKEQELEKCVKDVKSKPSTTGNHDLLIQYQSRLMELRDIISLIDSKRSDNEQNKKVV